jgi:hypothetical protein
VPIDVSAPAELFRKGQHVPAHGLKEPYTFGDLIHYVMGELVMASPHASQEVTNQQADGER